MLRKYQLRYNMMLSVLNQVVQGSPVYNMPRCFKVTILSLSIHIFVVLLTLTKRS